MRVGFKINLSVEEAAAVRKVLRSQNITLSEYIEKTAQDLLGISLSRNSQRRAVRAAALLDRLRALRVLAMVEYRSVEKERKAAISKRLGNQPGLPFDDEPHWY